MPVPQEFLAAAELGTRVVVRYRVEGGLTDALGELVARTDLGCTIRTRRTDVVVPLALVVSYPLLLHRPEEFIAMVRDALNRISAAA